MDYSPIIRTPSKWCVTIQEFPGKYYPGYCSGYAILYSPDSVFLLYRAAQREPYFWVDDVHVTGTVAAKVNLTRSSFVRSLILLHPEVKKLLDNPDSQREFIIVYPNLSQNHTKSLYHLTSRRKLILGEK